MGPTFASLSLQRHRRVLKKWGAAAPDIPRLIPTRVEPMNVLLEPHLQNVKAPANLRINDQINRFREECREKGCHRPYHHFAFGQSPFPPPPPVVEALRDHAGEHAYLPTAGLPALREAVAGFYRQHFEFPCSPEQVIISPGSKEMISIVLAVLEGTVVIPTPSWVSYLPQARILRKEIITIRVRRAEAFKLTPDRLALELQRSSARQHILILNHPNNPTGVIYDRGELEALAQVCRRHNTVIISDEIYALTAFEPARFTSMMEVYPEGTVVTGGLSKDRSAGGYRLGVGVFPEDADGLRENVLKVAGSTYSCVATPIQHAALTAYLPDDEVERHIADCGRINAVVGRRIAELFQGIPGVTTSSPMGGFYLLLDFSGLRGELEKLGMGRSADLASQLLQVEHAALLPGDALLLPPEDLSFRCSYVDYDGEGALERWRRRPPGTRVEEERFVRDSCPLLVDGVSNVRRFVSQLRDGIMPRHF